MDDITIGYGHRVIASGISLSLEKGECVLLCGANGSGKTTLLKALAGHGAAMVPARIPKVGGFSVREFIRTGCYKDTSLSGRPSPEGARAMDEAMETLGIEQFSGRDISTLSDGEFQKACIASALARRSETILLDEPTAYLDPDSRIMVLQALRSVSGKRAVLFSSHDIDQAACVCTRVMGLTRDGRFLDSAAGTDREEIFTTCFERYGRETIHN